MTDIVDLTDRFSDIIDNYRNDTYGGLLDMDAWDIEDIISLGAILEQVIVYRVDNEIDDYTEMLEEHDEDEFDVMYDEYTDISRNKG